MKLYENDRFYWGKSYHTVLSTRMKDNGKLEVFFRDGLRISVDPAELCEMD